MEKLNAHPGNLQEIQFCYKNLKSWGFWFVCVLGFFTLQYSKHFPFLYLASGLLYTKASAEICNQY